MLLGGTCNHFMKMHERLKEFEIIGENPRETHDVLLQEISQLL